MPTQSTLPYIVIFAVGLIVLYRWKTGKKFRISLSWLPTIGKIPNSLRWVLLLSVAVVFAEGVIFSKSLLWHQTVVVGVQAPTTALPSTPPGATGSIVQPSLVPLWVENYGGLSGVIGFAALAIFVFMLFKWLAQKILPKSVTSIPKGMWQWLQLIIFLVTAAVIIFFPPWALISVWIAPLKLQLLGFLPTRYSTVGAWQWIFVAALAIAVVVLFRKKRYVLVLACLMLVFLTFKWDGVSSTTSAWFQSSPSRYAAVCPNSIQNYQMSPQTWTAANPGALCAADLYYPREVLLWAKKPSWSNDTTEYGPFRWGDGRLIQDWESLRSDKPVMVGVLLTAPRR